MLRNSKIKRVESQELKQIPDVESQEKNYIFIKKEVEVNDHQTPILLFLIYIFFILFVFYFTRGHPEPYTSFR
jgi:hypothetical protein